MKKINILYILSLLLVACSQDEIGSDMAHVAPLRITTDDLVTRVAINGDKFEEGDSISLSIYNLNNSPYFLEDAGNRYGSWNWYCYDYNGKTWDYSWQTEPKLSEEKAIVYATYPPIHYDLKYGSFVNITPSQDGSQQEYLYASSEGHNYENPTVNLQFRYALAMVTVNLLKGQMNAEDDIYVNSATLKNAENCTYIATNGRMQFPSGDIKKEENKQAAITLKVEQALSVTSPITTNFLVIPTNTSDGVILSLLINGKERQVRIPATVWEKGKRYTYNVTVEGDMEKTLFISEATITPRGIENGSSLSHNAQYVPIGGTIGTAVDLGLSVKWSDHNVGAINPYDIGGYYWWGDPTGTLTSSQYKVPTDESVSGTDLDIAKKQWGDIWRLPTNEEMKELVDNCYYQWTQRNGVNGGLLTSKINGASIFIPAGGVYVNNGILDQENGEYGAYWSDGFFTKDGSLYGRCLKLTKENVTSNYGWGRGAKLNVRPVCK